MEIYFDMDGVLAKWDVEKTQADTFEDGYFLEREIDPTAEILVRMLQTAKHDVTILSSAYVTTNARQEKSEWLKRHHITAPAIFVPYGMRKDSFVPNTCGVKILIDDYTKNLREWEESDPSHIGIKYRNGINGSAGTWTGLSISHDMSLESMMSMFKAIEKGRCCRW